jgi:hypothetical protein
MKPNSKVKKYKLPEYEPWKDSFDSIGGSKVLDIKEIKEKFEELFTTPFEDVDDYVLHDSDKVWQFFLPYLTAGSKKGKKNG